MDKDYLVTKSNYFIMNSSYDLSMEEQKIILTLASMVQPNDEEFKPYNFKIAEFMELLGVENQAKYTEIPKITKELMKKVFEIKQGNKMTQVAWLSSAEYEKGTGMVELQFSPKLKPYMIQLGTLFTQYKLANILSMKSKYSPRIYEILKCNEFKKQGYMEIGVDELRRLLKADNIYPLYNDFKRKIIFQAQKELNKISDIAFEFEEIKTGRKVTSIRFFIKSNTGKEKGKTLDEIAVAAEADPKVEYNIENGIETILKILKGYKVTPADALEIFKNSNKDVAYIAKVYEYSKTQDVRNLIGFMKEMVKPGKLQQHIRTAQKDNFNNFEQRPFDESLEWKLLGWHKEQDLDGEEYEQGMIRE